MAGGRIGGASGGPFGANRGGAPVPIEAGTVGIGGCGMSGIGGPGIA